MAEGTERIPQIPELDGDLWRIGPMPDLGEELNSPKQQAVDHAIFPSDDGAWHCWSCIRGTQIGRLLYHWEGASLEQADWAHRGVAMRADRSLGESTHEPDGKEWIQAPHVVIKDGVHHMFYGGHRCETEESQICLARSDDGHDFERYRNPDGLSRLFVGPGEARDPMVIKIGDLYYCYYCGHDTGERKPCKIYLRTSDDLLHWSDYKEVNWGGEKGGDGPFQAECPFVVDKDGYYYLFRTRQYPAAAQTHVYRSEDPTDFGCGDDSKWIACLRVSAPEVVLHDGQYYISSVEDLTGGIQLGKLKWVNE